MMMILVGSRTQDLSDPYCQLMCLSATLMVNYLGNCKIQRFVSNREPKGKCLWRVDWWHHVTMTS